VTLYVGNLSRNLSYWDVKVRFQAFGTVSSVRIPGLKDGEVRVPYAFIQMPDAEAAMAAIGALNGAVWDGLNIKVERVKPRPWRTDRSRHD